MMSPQHPGCPQCARMAVRKRDASSEYAIVNYYRCDLCGHVWTTLKDHPAETVDITEPRRRNRLPDDIKALKWRFDEMHKRGRKALAEGDYEGANAAIKIGREITAQLKVLIAQRRARIRRIVKIS